MWCLCLTLFLPLAVEPVDVVKPPLTIPHERGSTRASDKDGHVRWTAQWTMEPHVEQGRRAVRFTENGKGRYTPFPEDVNWSLEAVWLADTSFSPLRVERSFTNSKGVSISSERKTVDSSNSVIRFERSKEGAAPEIKSLPFSVGTLVIEGIAGVLRFLPFDSWQPFNTKLITNEPQRYDMKIELRGKEQIKTPAGVFDCYKIELVPQLGILNVVRAFAPKAYFWFTVSPPHFWVRYEGPEAGPSSPQISMELTTYEVGR
jgi:hypothetical protein